MRQDQDFINQYLEKGKETRHFKLVSCQQEHQNAQDRESWNNLALLCDWLLIGSNCTADDAPG